ncbi:DUF402 domain-containing protein [Gemelliphila palaticanis]|uniref:DUF402 domain-containing protein n=1 Tax=Gemelliphila palaticanis TaxID=81950 RepID=A0ABX2SYH6_9BACL|nr:DUF402 domain-containing protein [Gemella palaticanis]MBF0715128.1 DUF402 domain-containing protein [Gemella palaticanis]NYS47058.1 DUF402 domain-containing protein [Gemella palaticanis]
MYKDNIKPKKGDVVKIIAYKHDGSVHRIWHKNTVLEANDQVVILANNKTSVTEFDCRTWVTKEMALVYFHADCWFNIVCMFREDGIHYYCNLSSPFASDIDGIKYIDYDLDIKKYPDGKYFLLDEDEYNQHKKLYNYDGDLDKIIRYNLEKLQSWIEDNKGPFSKEFTKVWIENYNNIIK